MDVTAIYVYILMKERYLFLWSVCFVQGNMFLDFRVINGEYSVAISRCIV